MKEAPKNSNELFPWRTTEFIVELVLENPYNEAYDQEKQARNEPHGERERPHEGPRARVQLS